MDSNLVFEDRLHAGQMLGRKLEHYRQADPLVLGLARGGVVIAAQIACEIGAELDVLVARKLGAPWQPELGIGAIAPGGIRVVDESLIARLGITDVELEEIARREAEEVDRRLSAYRGNRGPLRVAGRTAILADDGLATGVTAMAAARYLRSFEPAKVVLAVPVCSLQAAKALRSEVDELLCLSQPDDFRAVGLWYRDFRQTEDDEVLALLRENELARGQ